MKRNILILFICVSTLLLVAKVASAESFETDLKQGWNLISIPVQPADTSTGQVFLSINGLYRDAWRYESFDSDDPWKHYHSDYTSFCDLTDIVHNNGYWIYLNQNATLTASGTPVTTNQTTFLKPGWNLIGWPFLYNRGILEALSPLVLGVHYDQVTRFNPLTQVQENFFDQAGDDFDTFEPGKAYYIHALSDCSATLIPDITPPDPPTVDSYTTPTNNEIQTISGKKDAHSSIWINGEEKVPIDELTTWSVSILLEEGDNVLNITSKDIANNESSPPTTVTILLDITAPDKPVVTDDGATTTNPTQLHATWNSQDLESGIGEYQYSIGTSAGDTSVVPWTTPPSLTQTEITHTGLNLTSGQSYFFNVKAKNNAGTWSEIGSSDGIVVNQVAPSITKITPPDGSLFEVGDIVSFNITANDLEGDDIYYKIEINGVTERDWSLDPTYDWPTSTKSNGISSVTVYVKDEWNNESSQELEVCLVEKPMGLPQL